jgi:CelD/BcsL family acetyltransferase involved in cellulose biosynthesis
MRRLLRSAEKAGATLQLAEGEGQIQTFFDQMIELHQARWMAAGKPGVFSAQRFTAFHRALAGQWTPDGRAVLARLAVGDRPLAVIYGFTIGSRFHFYQSGVAIEEGLFKSPGIVAFLLLMGALAGRGFEEFDFLRGSSEYKHRLATHEHALVKLTVVRPTLRSAVHYMGSLARRAAARGYRTLRRRGT